MVKKNGLYTKGDKSLLDSQCLAIVGTRNPTPLGRKIAYSLAATFASYGYTIVSGLALGIDTEAHRGTLSVNGRTIAVLGTPLHQIYPSENTDLAQQIIDEGGLLVSQYKTSERNPSRFVQRDLLQAEMSLAVMPIQAGRVSGTLHACREALRLGKHVFIPQPVESDEEASPESYVGIRWLMGEEGTCMFRGKEDYPEILRILSERRYKNEQNS
jgi:DNA processing protein